MPRTQDLAIFVPTDCFAPCACARVNIYDSVVLPDSVALIKYLLSILGVKLTEIGSIKVCNCRFIKLQVSFEPISA